MKKITVVMTVVMSVLIVQSAQLTGDLALASAENDAPLPNDSEETNYADHPIIDGLIETVNELMETIRGYMAQVQQIFMNLIAQIVSFLIGVVILVIVIIILLYIRQKHIKIIDAKSGKTIGKQKLKIYPRTNVDLTKSFEHASSNAVRVQFLKTAIKKLIGCRVLFLKDGQLVSEIENYTGELEVRVTLPETQVEERSDSTAENGQPEGFSPGEDEDSENNLES